MNPRDPGDTFGTLLSEIFSSLLSKTNGMTYNELKEIRRIRRGRVEKTHILLQHKTTPLTIYLTWRNMFRSFRSYVILFIFNN